MQVLGTEWGRKLIHEDLWVRAWMREAVWMLQNGRRLAIDDLRYPNELDAVLRLGGATIRIVRKDLHQVESHDSETQFVLSQRVVVNDSDLWMLANRITAALDSLPKSKPDPERLRVPEMQNPFNETLLGRAA